MRGEIYPLFYTFHFYVFGVIAIASALVFVTRKSPVAAALWLVMTMFALAAMYVLLDAHFIGAIQVLVYAGAIMVVFLFVIMLLNLGHPSELADAQTGWWKLGAGAVGVALISMIATRVRADLPESLLVPANFAQTELANRNAVGSVADPLFRADQYLLAFELTSILLLAAIVGAVVLGRRSTPTRLTTGAATDAEKRDARDLAGVSGD
ncbi:MAG TPA: NADH-quinone oxidoreductase subunit J [Gemmatimonadaceae bacterium]|nr:NADH-quinone oxidoreductase subunit J [Gemmatimonadaceae bacterium]